MFHRRFLHLLFATSVSVAALAQSDESLAPRQIVEKCAVQTGKINRLRSSYTYKFREKTDELDSAGRVKTTHSSVVEILYFGGKPYEHLLEKDGHELPAREHKREEEKMNRAALEASKLTPEEQQVRLEKLERERDDQNNWMRYVGEAYDFKFLPEKTVNGRPTFVIRADPKPAYRGKYGNMLRRTSGMFFVDKRDFTLTRLEAEVLDRISLGLFLVRLSPGTRITFEQTLVNNEVWLPKQVTVHADARALVKAFRFDTDLEFSDYRKFQSESRIVSTEEAAPSRDVK